MTSRIITEADLDVALAALIKADERFNHALSLAGRPPLRKRADGFAGLAAIVVSQQLSTASAKAIWGRLEAALDPLDHAAVLRARAPKLARAGLSAPKIRTLKAIAKAIDRGELDLPALVEMPADEAHRLLTAVHGIGPWTADIYLLACLGHADAWPAGDLALAGSGAAAVQAEGTADHEGDAAAGGAVAAVARAPPPACCGPTIAPPSSATARRSR